MPTTGVWEPDRAHGLVANYAAGSPSASAGTGNAGDFGNGFAGFGRVIERSRELEISSAAGSDAPNIVAAAGSQLKASGSALLSSSTTGRGLGASSRASGSNRPSIGGSARVLSRMSPVEAGLIRSSILSDLRLPKGSTPSAPSGALAASAVSAAAANSTLASSAAAASANVTLLSTDGGCCVRGRLEWALVKPGEEVVFALLHLGPAYTVVGEVAVGPEIFGKVCWKLRSVNGETSTKALTCVVRVGDVLGFEGPQWATERLRRQLQPAQELDDSVVDEVGGAGSHVDHSHRGLVAPWEEDMVQLPDLSSVAGGDSIGGIDYGSQSPRSSNTCDKKPIAPVILNSGDLTRGPTNSSGRSGSANVRSPKANPLESVLSWMESVPSEAAVSTRCSVGLDTCVSKDRRVGVVSERDRALFEKLLPVGLPRICLLSSLQPLSNSSEELLKAVGLHLGVKLAGHAVVITDGSPGAQQVFAQCLAASGSIDQAAGPCLSILNLVPRGQGSAYGVGENVHCGKGQSSCRKFKTRLAHICISVEGGPGVASEAWAVIRRGAKVVPLMCTGGASKGLHDFPAQALEKPEVATEEQWDTLRSAGTPRAASDIIAAAAAEVVLAYVRTLVADPAFAASSSQAHDFDDVSDSDAAGVLSSNRNDCGFDEYRSMPSWSYRPDSYDLPEYRPYRSSWSYRPYRSLASSAANTERAPVPVLSASIDDAGLSWEFAHVGNVARPVVPRLDLARVTGTRHRAKSETRSILPPNPWPLHLPQCCF